MEEINRARFGGQQAQVNHFCRTGFTCLLSCLVHALGQTSKGFTYKNFFPSRSIPLIVPLYSARSITSPNSPLFSNSNILFPQNTKPINSHNSLSYHYF